MIVSILVDENRSFAKLVIDFFGKTYIFLVDLIPKAID